MSRIRIGNREIKKILTSQLLQLGVKKPHTQRMIDKTKVKEIVSYQLDQIKKNKFPNFLGVINIHLLSTAPSSSSGKDEEGTYYLVDGQHRYNAIVELHEKHAHDLEVAVEIVKVETKEELVHNYNLINKNTPLPEFPEDVDKSIPEQATRHFQEKYPEVWTDKSRAKRPNVKFNSFQETLGQVVSKLQGEIDSAVGLIQEIEELNKEISLWDREKFKGVSEPMYQKAKQLDFFLGLMSYPSKKGEGYEWGDLLINRKKTPPRKENISESSPGEDSERKKQQKEEVKKSKAKKRKTPIPKKVKNDCWDIYVGKECAQAYCIVCDRTKIDSRFFQAGHIISEKNGGKCTIDNIIPICSGCNQSMGPMNMREYVRRNYPGNLENFDKRCYRK